MLQMIQGLPPHVVGVHATGEITKEDLETVLIPAIDKLVLKPIRYTTCYTSIPTC
jgi:hypothetical protein